MDQIGNVFTILCSQRTYFERMRHLLLYKDPKKYMICINSIKLNALRRTVARGDLEPKGE